MVRGPSQSYLSDRFLWAASFFEEMDQIDFTGPFEVLSRMPDTTVQIIGKELSPVRDVQGLRLSPEMSITEAGLLTCYSFPEVMGSRR